MSRTLADLATQLRGFSVGIQKEASQAASNVALEIVRELAQKTPVDTSRALSNWRVGLGRPESSSITPHFPGILGDTKSESATATVDAARDVLTGKRPGQPVYIANFLTYIDDLNEGKSRQAPAGYVESAIAAGRIRGMQLRKRDLNV